MGLQFTWSVEMAYGTPFLLQLGLSKSLMSLVWLAGPLSGLVMQPVVGVLSDRCTLKMGRRRPFLIVGVAAVVLSFLGLGWCKEIMGFVVGSESPRLDGATILMAVASIYILDFAINCVQASCRTLIVDSLPSSQQEAAAAWASRLMGLGGIFGYFMGNVNIPELIPAFGDTQVKGLCVIACLFLVLCVATTCFTVSETFLVQAPKASTSFVDEFLQGFRSIFLSIRNLPTRIQHLCNVQFFAWMGWFPFLFYSSTYIAEIYTREQTQKGAPVEPVDPEEQAAMQDAALRAGSYCLLIYSIVSLGASLLLPIFVAPAPVVSTVGAGPLSRTASNGSGNGILGAKRKSKWGSSRTFSWFKLPVPWLTLPRTYTLSLVLVSLSLMGTWPVQDLRGSTILFSFCGIAWAVSMWAPFSILGEVISQKMQEEQHQQHQSRSSDDDGRISHDFAGETIFSKDDEGEDIEEIRMSEGRRYQPLKGRESLEHVIIADTSQHRPYEGAGAGAGGMDTFRARSVTPVSAVMSTSNAGNNHPNIQEVRIKHIDTDSETDNSGEGEGSFEAGSLGHNNDRRIQQREERRLVRPYIRPLPKKNKCSGSRRENHNVVVVLDDEANRRRSSFRSSAYDPETTASSAGRPHSMPSPALSNREDTTTTMATTTSAGALLGIHNIYIVLPQFLVSFLSSLVFAAIEPKPSSEQGGGSKTDSDEPGNPDTIGVMLRFGGVMAGVAALLSLRLWKQPRSTAPASSHLY
ncbi:hypothetical protein BG004_006866 [Podila humilis]|nr:hypothetical protein BG004_006866 [Podila humilis]